LGVTLGVVILLRMAWRASSGRRLPLAAPGFIGYGAKIVHYGLYLLIVATVALGIANVWVRGDSIFGLLTVPTLAPGDQVLKETVEDLHGWFANAVSSPKILSPRSEEHTSELQSPYDLVCRLLLE